MDIHCISPQPRCLGFYRNPKKLETPRFLALSNVAFKMHSSVDHLFPSPKLKRKSVLCLYLSKDIPGIQIVASVHPFFSFLQFFHFLLPTTNCPPPTLTLSYLPGLYLVSSFSLPHSPLIVNHLLLFHGFFPSFPVGPRDGWEPGGVH